MLDKMKALFKFIKKKSVYGIIEETQKIKNQNENQKRQI